MQGESPPCQTPQECLGRRVHPQDRPDRRLRQEPPQAECQQDRAPAKSCLTQLLAEADRDPDQALPHVETAVRFNPDQDLSQMEERHPLGGLKNGVGESLQRQSHSGRTRGTGDALVRTSTPAGREDRASRVGVESFLR